MKGSALLASLLLAASAASGAKDATAMSENDIRQLVERVNDAQNRMMMRGSGAAEVEAMFDLYTEDFTYVHEAYGGVYTRQALHGNSVRFAKAGEYQFTEDRYRILHILPGHDAAAVQRLESNSGNRHLAVFEFKDGKVSKIVEYWK